MERRRRQREKVRNRHLV
jgi:hypothetical protein